MAKFLVPLAFQYILYLSLLLAIKVNSFGLKSAQIAKYQGTSRPCVKIRLSVDNAILLYSASSLNPDDLDSFRRNKLANATFEIFDKCRLTICGFTHNGTEPYNNGTCEYYETSQSAPLEIFGTDKDYEMSTLSCGCQDSTPVVKNCDIATCVSQNQSVVWNDQDCAILYQEKQCQECYGIALRATNGSKFSTANSFLVASMLARPECIVKRFTNGHLAQRFEDPPHVETFQGLVPGIEPSYYGDPETFSFYLPPTNGNPPADESTKVLYLVVIAGTVVAVAFATLVCFLAWKKFYSTPGAIETRPLVENEAGSGAGEQPEQPEVSAVGTQQHTEEPGAPAGETKQSMEKPGVSTVGIQSSTEEPGENQQLADEPEVSAGGTQQRIEEPGASSGKSQQHVKVLQVQRALYDTHVQLFVKEKTAANTEEDKDWRSLLDLHSCKDLATKFKKTCHYGKQLSPNSFTWNAEDKLGSGEFGVVYKGQLKLGDNKMTAAVKKLKLEGQSTEQVVGIEDSFLREIFTFQKLETTTGMTGSEYIVKFYGACCCLDGLFLLTEFCAGGSLKNNLSLKMALKYPQEQRVQIVVYTNGTFNVKSASFKKEDLLKLLKWSYQVASVMDYLNKARIIYTDLATRNVLLTREESIKIVDFGLSGFRMQSSDYIYLMSSSKLPMSAYFAPELLQGPDATKVFISVDKWAFGHILWEMFNLGTPFYEGMTELQATTFLRQMQAGTYFPGNPPLCPGYMYTKMRECWRVNPAERPGFEELCSFLQEKTQVETLKK